MPRVRERSSRYALSILDKRLTADAMTSCRLQPHLVCAVGREEGHHVRNCLLCVCEEQQGGDHPAQMRPEALISPVVRGTLRPPGKSVGRVYRGALGHCNWGALTLLCCVCAFSENSCGTPSQVLGNLCVPVSLSSAYRFPPPLRGCPDQQDRSQCRSHSVKSLCGIWTTTFSFSLWLLHTLAFPLVSV